jgi:hypothetical protein
MDNIAHAFTTLFKKHRIIFCMTPKMSCEPLDLSGIEKIELDSNELGIKQWILKKRQDRL